MRWEWEWEKDDKVENGRRGKEDKVNGTVVGGDEMRGGGDLVVGGGAREKG